MILIYLVPPPGWTSSVSIICKVMCQEVKRHDSDIRNRMIQTIVHRGSIVESNYSGKTSIWDHDGLSLLLVPLTIGLALVCGGYRDVIRPVW